MISLLAASHDHTDQVLKVALPNQQLPRIAVLGTKDCASKTAATGLHSRDTLILALPHRTYKLIT